VRSSVATVMPEIGFEELPTSPVSRELTVTKRNPNRTTRIAPTALMRSDGASVHATTRTSAPAHTTMDGRSRSVRSALPAGGPDAASCDSPRAAPPTMVGSDRASEKMPPAATAPAPM
jgi:hypothetical protein